MPAAWLQPVYHRHGGLKWFFGKDGKCPRCGAKAL